VIAPPPKQMRIFKPYKSSVCNLRFICRAGRARGPLVEFFTFSYSNSKQPKYQYARPHMTSYSNIPRDWSIQVLAASLFSVSVSVSVSVSMDWLEKEPQSGFINGLIAMR